MQHIADNHEALLDYLYEEGDPAERLKIARHLQDCAACSVAVLEFQNVRGMLRDWRPPTAELGFRVVRDAADTPARAGAGGHAAWWRPEASWTRAAAAALVFAAGMAVSQLTFDYGDGELVVRSRPAASAANVQTVSARTASIPLPPEKLGLVPQRPADAPDAASIDTERLLQRVRAMIDQSEQRQHHELALRLSQIASEVDTQHQADLLRIQQSMGQQQDDFMNYLVRTSGGAK